jgi:hypothetical protein
MSVGNIQITVITPAAVGAAISVGHPAAAAAAAAPAKSAAPEKTTSTPVKAATPVTSAQQSDAASLSDTAVLLSGLDYQLTTSRPSDYKSLLEGAARSIDTAAQQQDSHEQTKTLENIADRLRFAANIAGLSNRSPLSIEAFLS